MNNLSVRRQMAVAGLRQWEVAEAYGLSEGSFCRLLRHELTEDQRQRVVAAIEKAKENKGS